MLDLSDFAGLLLEDFDETGVFSFFDATVPGPDLAAFLGSTSGAVLRVFWPGFLTDVRAEAPTPFLEGALEDFLRAVLDIPLPFVAFSGSLISLFGVLRLRPGCADGAGQICRPRSMVTTDSKH